MGRSALLVGRWRERGGGLVAVGGGRGGGVVPLWRTGSILTALRQVGPLWEGGTPLLIRATQTKSSVTCRWCGVSDVGRILTVCVLKQCLWGSSGLTGTFVSN